MAKSHFLKQQQHDQQQQQQSILSKESFFFKEFILNILDNNANKIEYDNDIKRLFNESVNKFVWIFG